MEKSEFAGFVKGMTAGNIASNLPTIDVYSDEIKTNLFKISSKFPASQIEEKTRIMRLYDSLNNVTVNNLSPNDLISLFLRLGSEFKVFFVKIPEELRQSFEKENKEIIYNYLSIAKIIKDSRIDSIGIELAKSLSQFYNIQ